MKSIAGIIDNTNRIVDASAWVRRLTDQRGFSVSSRMKKKGRPAGAETRYPNILRFCRLHGYAPQHVRACLDGQRPYADRVKTRWEQFVAAGV